VSLFVFCVLLIVFAENRFGFSIVGCFVFYNVLLVHQEYTPPRHSVEYAEDGSLFGARSDTLFEMLVSGYGAQTNVDFESAFMYGFRAWITPVSLLQRLIETFCTTPTGSEVFAFDNVFERCFDVITL
jgi:hypothetical protein